MINQNHKLKRITIISFIISILGLLSELVPYIYIVTTHENYNKIDNIRRFCKFVELSFVRNYSFEFSYFDSQLSSNTFQLLFYIIMLLGTVLFIKKKDNRILKFSYSIILLSNLISFIFITIYISFYRDVFEFSFLFFFEILKIVLLFIFSYWILKKAFKLSLIKDVDPDSNVLSYPKSSLKSRCLHLFLDALLAWLVFSNFSHFFRNWLEDFSRDFGKNTSISLVLVLFTTLYYLFYEIVLKNSPAKYLTRSFIVSSNKEDVSIKQIVIRTLSRQIPFNPISFVFGGNWHDKLSKTEVVQTKPFKLKSKKQLLWLIPIGLVISLFYFGPDYYVSYLDNINNQQHFENQTYYNKENIKKIAVKDVITIRESGYGSKDYYLVVEEVNSETVSAQVIKHDYTDMNTPFQAYKASLWSNDYDIIRFSRKDLLKAMPETYKALNGFFKENGVNLLNDEDSYLVANVTNQTTPYLHETIYGGLSGNGTIDFNITNIGAPCTLTKIENIKGDLTWSTELPFAVSTETKYGRNLPLKASNYLRGSSYKFKLYLENEDNETFIYTIEGKNLNQLMLRVK